MSERQCRCLQAAELRVHDATLAAQTCLTRYDGRGGHTAAAAALLLLLMMYSSRMANSVGRPESGDEETSTLVLNRYHPFPRDQPVVCLVHNRCLQTPPVWSR